jgi:hypothetical protein
MYPFNMNATKKYKRCDELVSGDKIFEDKSGLPCVVKRVVNGFWGGSKIVEHTGPGGWACEDGDLLVELNEPVHDGHDETEEIRADMLNDRMREEGF